LVSSAGLPSGFRRTDLQALFAGGSCAMRFLQDGWGSKVVLCERHAFFMLACGKALSREARSVGGKLAFAVPGLKDNCTT
jgi:hypothetical protein